MEYKTGKFNIGDRIKIIKIIDNTDTHEIAPNYLIGQTGMIKDIDKMYEYPYEVKFDNEEAQDADAILWKEDELDFENDSNKTHTNKKYKIIGVSNFDLDSVNDILIADNLNEHYGKLIEELLQNNTHEHDRYYPRLVDQDYELYVWEP